MAAVLCILKQAISLVCVLSLVCMFAPVKYTIPISVHCVSANVFFKSIAAALNNGNYKICFQGSNN